MWLDAADDNPASVEFKTTLAPFHPDWRFANNDAMENEDSVAFEKKSPAPTVSIVSTAVIDKAGAAATEQIGFHNSEVLQSKSAAEWKLLYDQAIHLSAVGESAPLRSNMIDDVYSKFRTK